MVVVLFILLVYVEYQCLLYVLNWVCKNYLLK